MKSLVALLACLALPLLAEDERAPSNKPTPADSDSKLELEPHDRITQRSLARLAQKLGVTFNHPFPAEFDCDAYRKQPIALLPVEGGKVSVTRPIINPYDGRGTIEWMIGTEQIQTLGRTSLDALVYMDEEGEFIQISLPTSPDDWSGEAGTPQLARNEGESGKEFVERALLTYRLRAKKAEDPQQALLLLSGFEKTLTAIHQCRRDEVFLNP